MTVNLAHIGLAINSPLITQEALNFRPTTWPPLPDFPIVIDADGKIISKYGDPIWNLSPWAKKPLILNFGDGPKVRGMLGISPSNAALFRQITAWWLYGPNAIQKPMTLKARFTMIRALFLLCSKEGVIASDLMRFPLVTEQLPNVISPSSVTLALTVLHSLYEQREQLGFTLLNREGLTRLEAVLPEHESRQTPYIPSRIWVYQVSRLRTFLDDFHAHREEVEACYHFCLDAYAKNFGSLANACQDRRKGGKNPFGIVGAHNGNRSEADYLGSFWQTAKRFKIDELLFRWCVGSNKSASDISLKTFSTYFSMVGYVGTAYLLNFSLMRFEEGWKLRTNCLEIEKDERFGSIYILRGETTKTVDDNDARWPTSPSVQVAVDAMSCISRLRMICATANSAVPTSAEDVRNPYLYERAYEPWAGGVVYSQSLSVRLRHRSYLEVIEMFPNLFDLEELRINEADLQQARLITPTLNGEMFDVGNVWPLAWHQLRRTGAVNMLSSGLVSDASLQYQLKHTTRNMSLYYGQGYSSVKLDEKARGLYVRTMYEVLGMEISRLLTDRFISPHGEKRKAEILKLVDPADNKSLLALAMSGKVSWRETLLGGCAKRGPCPFGGVDNIAHCGGGDSQAPCPDVLYDRERVHEIRKLGHVINLQLNGAPFGSPYRESLEAQLRAVENTLNVIES